METAKGSAKVPNLKLDFSHLCGPSSIENQLFKKVGF
jgi:hypothetical protein